MRVFVGFFTVLCLIQYLAADGIQKRITDVLEAATLSESESQRLAQFRQFVSEFHRHYESDSELQFRFEAFKANMDNKDHYEANEKGTAEYGMTEFMDYEQKELARFSRICKNEPLLSDSDSELFEQMVEVGNAVLYSSDKRKLKTPTSVDYRKKKWISKVLDQGYCSSSWAYAAVTALETTNAVKTGHFQRLSKQQLIDCDSYNEACCGGYPHYAYLYLNKTGGIELDKTYNGRPAVQRCHFKPANAKVQVMGITLFTNTSMAINEKLMEQHIAEHGPIAVMLSAGALPAYKKGILKQADSKCSKNSDELVSSVALVGYGEEDGIKYWIAKNSWGPRWGEKGYLRIERGRNMCAIASYGVAPVLG